MACLPLFYIFCPAFCPFVLSVSSLVLLSPALLLGFLPCLLSCSLSCFLALLLGFWCWLGCCFFFPFGLYVQKERARRVGASSLVLLWVCYMFSASLSADSFAFENIHPAPQVKCALNLPPRVFKVSLIARVSPTIAIAFSE